jgi:hypothetical protein
LEVFAPSKPIAARPPFSTTSSPAFAQYTASSRSGICAFRIKCEPVRIHSNRDFPAAERGIKLALQVIRQVGYIGRVVFYRDFLSFRR